MSALDRLWDWEHISDAPEDALIMVRFDRQVAVGRRRGRYLDVGLHRAMVQLIGAWSFVPVDPAAFNRS